MCQVTTKADGTPDSSTAKMQDTGRSWSGKGPEAFYDNIPTAGMVLGDSVSRWTTQNKLFRVLDPRGFEVEVPTGNVSTLLNYCTVVKGVIQEECVWGREGGSHILLPVTSEPYVEARKVIHKVANELLKMGDLQLGDRVKVMSQGDIIPTEYEFFGIVKLSWLRKCSKNRYRSSHGYSWNYRTELIQSIPLEDETIQDDKWVAVLGSQVTQRDYSLPMGPERDASERLVWRFDYELSPKIVERRAGTPSATLSIELAAEYRSQYAPQRVSKRFTHEKVGYSSYEEWRIEGKDSIVDIQFKPVKK